MFTQKSHERGTEQQEEKELVPEVDLLVYSIVSHLVEDASKGRPPEMCV